MDASTLDDLKRQAQKLELSASRRKSIDQKVLDYADNFLNELSSLKAFEDEAPDSTLQEFSEEPAKIPHLLEQLYDIVDTRGLNPASGKNMGYIPGGGLYPSALADYLAAISNRYAGIRFSGPGAVQMEEKCIRWLCDLIGYPAKAGGNLASDDSIANLIAVVNARDVSGIRSKDYEKAVIYSTQQLHHCLDKAIKFAGLGDAQQRRIAMDSSFRMKTDSLEAQIKQDIAHGLKPLILLASAGTTDVGAVDPLEEFGQIAAKYNIWFHVDAAYGGAFLLTKHGKKKMRGIRAADSVVIDPHKGLFLPYGISALLVKDVSKLYASQHMSANYLQDAESEDMVYSPADLSPELTKHVRGLRMWLPLQLFGIALFRSALNEKLLLTRYFYREIQQIEGIEVGPEPELSVLIFRYVPQSGDANQFNEKLLETIRKDGRVFLSSTRIDDLFYIRLAVLSFRTHMEQIEQVINIIKEKIGMLKRY